MIEFHKVSHDRNICCGHKGSIPLIIILSLLLKEEANYNLTYLQFRKSIQSSQVPHTIQITSNFPAHFREKGSFANWNICPVKYATQGRHKTNAGSLIHLEDENMDSDVWALANEQQFQYKGSWGGWAPNGKGSKGDGLVS